MNFNKSDTEGRYMKLTPKEHDVLTLIACGLTDKEVALKLKISVRTVQAHMSKVMLKLNAQNRVNAAIVYYMHNPKWRIGERYVIK